MKQLLKTEEIAQLLLAVAALYYQPIHIAWWAWTPLFLSPDVSMMGYLLNTHVGAIMYNIAHHKGIAGILIIAGIIAHLPVILFTGLLLWAHASFDRVMGYGLKYTDSFHHTHMGMIGIKKEAV